MTEQEEAMKPEIPTEELLKWVNRAWRSEDIGNIGNDEDFKAAVGARLLEHDALKAEVERLNAMIEADDTERTMIIARAEKAESALALAKPVLDVAPKVLRAYLEHEADDMTGLGKAMDELEAALTYRAAVQAAAKEGWQDENRTYTPGEQQLDVRLDCAIGREGVAQDKFAQENAAKEKKNG